MHWLTRWLMQHLLVGLSATIGAVLLAFVLDVAIDSRWDWERFALGLLALAVFVLLCAFSTPGVGPPGAHSLGWDAKTAYIEMAGREAGGTFGEHKPPSGGVAALVTMTPPAIALLVIVSAFL